MPSSMNALDETRSQFDVRPLDGEALTQPQRKMSGLSEIVRPRLDALTFLRFLAAFAVVVHHSMDTFRLPACFTALNPALAVSFFFVLSGFILSYVYPKLEGTKEILQFWRARIARCWPLHMVCFALFAYVFGYCAGFDGLGHPRRGPTIANVLLVQAWFPNHEYFFGFNAPSWSVSVEFFFYFCFPFLQIWRNKRQQFLRASLIVVAAAVLTFLCAFLQAKTTNADVQLWLTYINPLSRLFEFVLGMWCATIYSSIRTYNTTRIATTIQLTSTVIFLAFITHLTIIPVACPLQVPFAIFTSLLILSLALDKGLLSRSISGKVATKLGDISYALYLIHYVLSNSNHAYWEKIAAENNVAAFAFYVAACLVLSLLAHQLIELPMRNLLAGKRKAYT